eukprot:892240-Amphidinium_carterae.1
MMQMMKLLTELLSTSDLEDSEASPRDHDASSSEETDSRAEEPPELMDSSTTTVVTTFEDSEENYLGTVLRLVTCCTTSPYNAHAEEAEEES